MPFDRMEDTVDLYGWVSELLLFDGLEPRVNHFNWKMNCRLNKKFVLNSQKHSETTSFFLLG